MARVIGLILLALTGALGQTISIKYGTVPREDVERRLKTFQNSNSKREAQLKQLFEEAGCSGDQLTEQPVPHSKQPNLICTLPGETDSIVLVGAHFDFVDRGRGVVDNWSGASLLPTFYLSEKAAPHRHTFVFVGFTDEEKGMVGSKFYVQALSPPQLAKISAMVNIDSIGLGPTKVELDRADKRLTSTLAQSANVLNLPLGVVNVHKVGRADADSFQDKNIAAVTIHSITQQTWPILHTSRDQMNAIQLDDYYNTYLVLRVYLASLDQTLDAPAAAQ